MRILINQLTEKLEMLKNSIFPHNFQMSGPFRYHVKNKGFSESEAQIPGSANNGVYIYTTTDNEILYIGKGEYSSGGGIGMRSCAHLGMPNRGSKVMFPNHQWVNEHVDPTIKNLIERGDFCIWTFPIEPNHFVSFVEVYFQTIYFDLFKSYPTLNKRIG